jgi:steroid delta-isomerase-like uncharacterized protein
MAVKSSTEQNKAVVTRFVEEVWENGNVGAIDTLFTEDSVLHDPTGDVRGREAFKTYNERYLAAFPDLQYDIEDMIAEGDRVVFRARMRGTHEGEFMGFEPTGQRFDAEGIIIARIEDGMIAERWASYDALGMMRQLGILPDAP